MHNLDKKRAENCIAKMKEFGTFRNQTIGKVLRDFPEPLPTYHKGDYIIIRDEGDGTYTAEIPKALEDIDTEKSGFITTIGTMINVPKVLIKQI